MVHEDNSNGVGLGGVEGREVGVVGGVIDMECMRSGRVSVDEPQHSFSKLFKLKITSIRSTNERRARKQKY